MEELPPTQLPPEDKDARGEEGPGRDGAGRPEENAGAENVLPPPEEVGRTTEEQGHPTEDLQQPDGGGEEVVAAGVVDQKPVGEDNASPTELEPASEEQPHEMDSESVFRKLKMSEEEFWLYLKPIAPISIDSEGMNCENLLCDFVIKNTACIFVETDDKICDQGINILKSLCLEFYVVRLDKIERGEEIKRLLFSLLKREQLPAIFIKGQLIGGYEELWYLHFTGLIGCVFDDKGVKFENNFHFEYELVVIGGGPAGISTALEAAKTGRKVAIVNYVPPTPRGRTWDIGGTSTNVGSVTKNLLYVASSYGVIREGYGVEPSATGEPPHWRQLMNNIVDYTNSLNFSIRCYLKEAGVETFNALARFQTSHDIELTFPNCDERKTLTTSVAVIASGSRPRIPSYVQGLAENGHTVEDLFRCATPPGKTLVLTSGYIGLEMATILAALNYPVTALVEPPISEEIDWEILRRAKSHMQYMKIVFLERLQIESIQKVDSENGQTLKVTGLYENQSTFEEHFDTVLYEYGRVPNTSHLGLCKIGIKVDRRTRKIVVDSNWRTSIKHVFAVGDVVHGWPELSSVAKKAGEFLIERIYRGILKDVDFNFIPERIIFPVEYARIGETEQSAVAKYGNRLKSYEAESRFWGHTSSSPLRDYVYLKVLCLEDGQQNEKVIAIHLMCHGAAEVIQGLAISLRNGVTKKELDDLIVLHATFCEAIVYLKLKTVKTTFDVYKAQKSKEKLRSLERALEETQPLRGKPREAAPAQFPLEERGSDESACERARERNKEPSVLVVVTGEGDREQAARSASGEDSSSSGWSSSSTSSSSTSETTSTSSSEETSSSGGTEQDSSSGSSSESEENN